MSRSAAAAKGGKVIDKAVDKSDKCGVCVGAVKDGEMGLQCEICEGWWHAKCENIGEEAYKVLQRENSHWFCVGCNKGVGSIIAAITKIQKRQEKCEKDVNEIKVSQDGVKLRQSKVEADMGKVKGELEAHAHEIGEIREAIKDISNSMQQQQVSQKQMESDESLWSTIVGKQVDKRIGTVKEEMHEVQKSVLEAKEHIDEEKEKDKRRNNIIIYRMQEGTAQGFEARRKEDLGLCQELVKDVLEIECNDDVILNVIRLGKREPTRVRPLLVVFKDAGIKNEVMEALGKLAEAEDKFRMLSVSHDLTQKEREECKELVEEARHKQQQDNSGEWVYRVRGQPGDMKVVKLRKRLQATGDNVNG